MADRPIISSAPMVRALLDGRKTQTRRIIRPEPDYGGGGDPRAPQNWSDPGAWGWEDAEHGCWRLLSEGYTGRPYYGRGMRLWVREAWRARDVWDGDSPHQIHHSEPIQYEATDPKPNGRQLSGRKRPSIHMPRWASRLTLTVTDVRVQRVQEISEADAMAEGAMPLRDWDGEKWHTFGPDGTTCSGPPTLAFAALWDALHGPGAWERNDWVCALTFTVHRANIDA
jgi:hypothetical protein